ncbi:Kef-type potassium/proton antiporter accessory protein, CPA2 family [Mariniphaga anaerophila]|uniref:Kef-type potassium/proton antiporter accessory protein, CPA2 family n=1 Tax=Mariniphaga anaerophila TaxID=1484053 RepID=A0A1M5ANS3_9BACT|nr:NAD(P)H-dependent oxidoreductase [Mariniphaga anaerophila]SHF31910.1 Kef-type potassium/proton antiporter accessory protein, CPA2 family [Mariniphaga anaerophila]
MNRILVEFAHPAIQKSRINRRLIQAVKELENVTLNDLYEKYPDFFIDVKKEQQLLLEHDIIVWHHPFYWYSAPALLKEWMDLVLVHGWAYGEHGRMLEGKTVLSVISTGGRLEVYSKEGRNRFSIQEFLVPFKQSANLCRMEYLPPFVVHGAHTISDNEISEYAENYKKALTMLRSDAVDRDRLMKAAYFNDLIE